jgi:hypothetical protein
MFRSLFFISVLYCLIMCLIEEYSYKVKANSKEIAVHLNRYALVSKEQNFEKNMILFTQYQGGKRGYPINYRKVRFDGVQQSRFIPFQSSYLQRAMIKEGRNILGE